MVKTKFFPIPIFTQMLLLALAILIGSSLYGWLTLSFYNQYKSALLNAQVIETLLSKHGISAMTTYESVLLHLTPRDFATIVTEAGIEDERDLETPADILAINKNGVGAWITSAILSTTALNGEPLHQLLLKRPHPQEGAKTSCDPNIGTLSSLIQLYSKLGVNDSSDEDGVRGGCQIYSDRVATEAQDLVEALAGQAPHMFPYKDINNAIILQDVIKSQMNHPWQLYTSKAFSTDKSISSFIYEEGNYKHAEIKTMDETRWFNKEPEILAAGVYDLSKLLINEVLSEKKVRESRFFYKAMKGWIQWGLMVFITYIALLLAWRFSATFFEEFTSDDRLFHIKPIMLQGSLRDIEQNAADSRTLIDQLISVCPLLGLFGTVMGIMLGLPEVAPIVMGGSNDVSALFEQLGLAFSTTAIAVLGVIMLETAWVQLQSFEDHALWRSARNSQNGASGDESSSSRVLGPDGENPDGTGRVVQDADDAHVGPKTHG